MSQPARTQPTAPASAHVGLVPGHTPLRGCGSIQANPLDRAGRAHALFAASFVRSLAHWLRCVARVAPRRALRLSLAGALAFACGQDAEKRYAGLEVISVQLPTGLGYRVRYLSPPWERVSSDPLSSGKNLRVPFGASAACIQGEESCRSAEPGSGTVLEVDRQSPTQGAGVLTYPKYRLEAAVLRCEPTELASTDECADVLAEQDVLGRRSEEGDDLVIRQEDGENDWGQRYRDILTQSRSTMRFRRIVYFAAPDRTRTVRLLFEANPSLAEVEVTRMVRACQLFEGEAEDDGDGVGDDAGAP
jgi:hypothetical protein